MQMHLRRMATLVLALTCLVPGTAWADHDGYYGRDDGGYYDDGCSGGGYCAEEDNRGDCKNVEDGGHCEDNDFSPKFDKSPVEDSFDPVICLPGSVCNIDDRKDQNPPNQG